MANIKDVAKYANVSVGTVSKYLNGITVRNSNKAKIDEAISVLGYRINTSARALKTNRTKTVAVFLPDIAGSYYPLIVKEIEYELYQTGYTVFIVDSHNRQIERKKINLMIDHMVDGFIVFPTENEIDNYRFILDQGRPLCIVDLFIPNFNCAQVVSDNIMAAYHAAISLIDHGHRRIAIITGKKTNTTAFERLRGYITALENFGLDIHPEYVYSRGFEESDGYDGFSELMALPNPPTAIITCNHHTTLGAVMCALDRKLQIPEDIDIVGFDYEQLPKLTRMKFGVVAQPIKKIAQCAVVQLMQQINNPDSIGTLSLQRIQTNFISDSNT